MMRAPIRSSRPRVAGIALAVVLLAVGCGRGTGTTEPGTVRLVELFEPEMVVERSEAERDREPVARWRFDGEPPTVPARRESFGWRAVNGIADLRVEEGRLVGTITDDLAALHVTREGPEPGEDQLHAVHVALQIGGGETITAALLGTERFDDERFLEAARGFAPRWSTDLSAAQHSVEHVLRSDSSQRASSVHQVALTLRGAAGETFRIEEVWITTEQQHLAAIDSGPGWQGLTDVFRETLVARSPERLRLPVAVPAPAPWLDLDVGTPETQPLRFVVRVAAPAAAAGEGQDEGEVVADRLVTSPHRWERLPVDLSRYAGREVVLELALAAEQPGTIGYWGSPVVRSRRVPGEGPQGVILLLVDTLRPDHLEVYGYERETSPALAALAARGARFTDVVAQATWTKASVPSIVTSLHPTSHGVADIGDRLAETAVTLAELYQEAGYATAAFSSVTFTGRSSNLQQGYEVLHERGSVPTGGYPSKTARELVNRAASWISAHRHGPFFVFLHVFDPHDPFRPRPPDDVRWAAADAEGRHRSWQRALHGLIEDPLLRRVGMPTRAQLERAEIDPETYVGLNVDWYDGSIRGMDTEVARLLARLEEMGLSDRVVIAVTSDHGEEFLEHGRTFHGQSVYGELAQVPLVLWGPGFVPAGAVVEETVRTLDIMPTLLELSGLPLPPFLQGQSLLPLLGSGDGWRPLPAVVEKAKTEARGTPAPQHTASYAIVSDGWKLVRHTERDEGTPEVELFDHAADRLNLHDVAADHPRIVERLTAELERWHEWALDRRLPETEREEELTGDERERLRALGYLD